MKKTFLAMTVLVFVLVGTSYLCLAAAPPQADVKLVSVDLSKASASFSVVMMAPEGAAATEDFGTVLVKKGAIFQVEVSSSPKDIAALKKEILANTLNKLKKFYVETADALLYESTLMGKSEFHFLANVKAGNSTYGAEDTKGPVYTKANVELMLKCFQTLKSKA
jgi:hypothetical protein